MKNYVWQSSKRRGGRNMTLRSWTVPKFFALFSVMPGRDGILNLPLHGRDMKEPWRSVC